MDCRDLVEVIGKSGIQTVDRPVPASSLGLPDVARVRLLAELDGLLRVYCAETSGNLPSASKLKSSLEGTGYNSLALATRDGQEFLAAYVAVSGEQTHKTLSATEVAGLLKNVGLAGEADATSASDRILELLTFEEEPKSYNNRGLFSDDYLEHRLPEGTEWAEDVALAYESFRELYEDKTDDLAGLDEANTEMEFVEPALALLGFHPIKRAKTKMGAIPDYALFGSAEDKNAASKVKKDSDAFYARTLAVVEGKYWGRNLDVYTKKEDRRETKKQSSSPEMQVVRYLRETEISWGILTNGAEWRLYHGDSLGKAKKYYSVDFARALASEEDFRRFYLFFRREAFVPKGPESKSFLDRVLEGSERYAIRVGNNLKDVIFTRVFPQLAKGFLEYHVDERKEPVDEEALKMTYRGTLTLLYRLLFLLYAEARDLLPTGDRLGYGARGINAIKGDVAKHRDEGYTYTGGYVLWQSLADLFRVVEGGNEPLKVPPYNGGLFKDDGNHELLGTHRISDHQLAPALDALARQKDEDGENRFVDYGFVGVRELGSVYEGLLEFSLKIADEDLVAVKEKGKEVYVKAGAQGRKKIVGRVSKGEPYLVNDKKERKATGSYYTPRYIVDYIIENTLGPLVEERREALKAKLDEVRRTDDFLKESQKSEEYRAERRREADTLETLLDVKVLDPAMGSGHFLVAAVDYLTDEFSRLISELDAEPIIGQLASLREEIEDSLEHYGTEAGAEQLSDANLLKRMILKRCVYGVDLNEMAVELAKLSLWLDAFTVGAPLSFLDHHLKHGNCLIGSSVREVRREVESSGTLLGNQFTALLVQGTELMQQVGETPDATESEVRQSISNYRRADEVLQPYKRVMDVWTSEHFGNVGAQSFLKDELSSGGADSLIKGDYAAFAKQGRETVARAGELSEDRHFFHWELEFPEAFFDGARERRNPGFDAIVSNPPYLGGREWKEDAGRQYSYFVSKFAVTEYQFDIYVLFWEQGIRLLKKNKSMGLITPNTWLNNQSNTKLRSFILENTSVLSITDYSQVEVFPHAVVLPIVTVLRREDDPTGLVDIHIPVNGSVQFSHQITQDAWKADEHKIFNIGLRNEDVRIRQKVEADAVSLDSLALVKFGVKLYETGKGTPPQQASDAREHIFEANAKLHDQYRAYLEGKDIDRYEIKWRSRWLQYGANLAAPRDPELFEGPRLLMRRIVGARLIGAFTDSNYVTSQLLQIVKPFDKGLTKYLLSVLNSSLIAYYFKKKYNRQDKTFPEIRIYELASLPICLLELSVPAERQRHDQIVELVDKLIAMQEKRAQIEHDWREWIEAAVPRADRLTKDFRAQGWVEVGCRDGWDGVKAVFQTRGAIPPARTLQELRRETEDALEKLCPLYERIEATDRLIDQIVYRLYGLTEEEISVVEESMTGV